MRQLAAFLALVGSYWLAGSYSRELMPYVGKFIENPKLVFLVSFALLFCLSALLFILGGKVLHRVMELASLLYMFLASSLSASNDLLKKSISSRYLAQGADILPSLRQQRTRLRRLRLNRNHENRAGQGVVVKFP